MVAHELTTVTVTIPNAEVVREAKKPFVVCAFSLLSSYIAAGPV